jgi:hypothetical protein
MQKKTYTMPSLATYGRLEAITLGLNGDAPDVAPFTNINCVTAVNNGVTLTCATQPSH